MRTQRPLLFGGCSVLLAAAFVPTAYSQDHSGLEPAVVTSSAARSVPAATPTPTSKPAAATAPASAATPGRTQDRIELETTQISGNRELPKVMYVVPWRKPDLGDFSGRPPNSLLDEALEPLDRDVFRRQNRYYASVASEAAASPTQPGAPAVAPASQPAAPAAAPMTPMAPMAPMAKDEK